MHVFSISLNAEKLVARLHRTIRIPNSKLLQFCYDDLYTLYNYSKNEACLLIRSMLLEYGVARLRGYLAQAAPINLERELMPLESLDAWKLPEVQDAVQRMKVAAASAAGAQPPQAESSARLETSKRAAKSKASGTAPNKRVRRKRGGRDEPPIDPSTSFGTSRLNLDGSG